MATFERRVNDDGSEMWRVKIRLRGHPAESKTFKRKTDAKNWAAATETAIREGRYFPHAEAKRHTVADLLDRYERDILPTKKDRGTQGPQLRWWRRELGALRLQELTPARIGDARDKLAARILAPRSKPKAQDEVPRRRPSAKAPTSSKTSAGAQTARKISPATVNRYLAVLSHALTVAVKEWGWLDDSPMRKVRKKPEPKGRIRFLDEDERQRLLEATKAGPPWLAPIVTLAISTGMRQGEILGLAWVDVDLERKRVVLHETKNGERRAVPLAGPALAALKEWSKVRTLGEGRVFPQTGGFHHRWWEALQRAHIEDFRFHDLRHTAASYLAMNGATTGELAAVLGHKSEAMVKRYAHLSDLHVAGVVERMNAKVFGSTQ